MRWLRILQNSNETQQLVVRKPIANSKDCIDVNGEKKAVEEQGFHLNFFVVCIVKLMNPEGEDCIVEFVKLVR